MMRILISVWMLCLLHSGVTCAQEKEVNKTVSLSPDGVVSVDTFKGSVTITSWDNPQVQIHVRIEPDGISTEDEEKVRNTEIIIDSSPSSVRIKSDYSKARRQSKFLGVFGGDHGNLPFVHYNLQVPRAAHVHIKDFKSDIKVADLRSDVKVNTFKGSAVLSGLNGPLELKTYKGEAKVEFLDPMAEGRLETFKGRIEMAVPKGKGFDLDADLGRRGNLDSDFELPIGVKNLQAHKARYRTAVNGGGPLLSLKTFKGHFRLQQR